jgi:MFS family permease
VASGFSALIGLRLVLGVGESAAFACASKLLATRLPPDRLGVANGVITLGLSLGPAFGAFAGGMLMAGIGWRPVFLVFGLASLLWLWPWIAASRFARSNAEPADPRPTPSLRAVLRKRDLWGASLGHFAGNYTLYFVVSWLPLFLVKARGFSMAEMATLSGAIYLAYAVSGWITGWATDRWIASGASPTLARKTFLIGGNLVTAAGMAVCAVAHGPVVIVTFFVIGVSFGFVSPNLFAVGQTLAGPRASGIWIGAQNCLGNIAGIVGPLLTGVLIDRTHAWGWAFAATGVSALLGVIGWAWIVQRVEPVDWD